MSVKRPARINLPRLWTFYNVAVTRSFTEAAQRLHLTQPAVSMQIAHLSKDLRVKLFERIEKHMELTDAGRILFRYAESIFNLADHAADEMASRTEESALRLEVAAGLLFVEHYLPSLIGPFQRKYPRVQFQIHTGPTRPLIEKLASYECHFAFLGEVPNDKAFVTQKIAEDRVVVIVAAKHPLAKRRTIKLEELTQWPVISFAKGSETRALFEASLQRAGLTVAPVMESFSAEGIKRAVEVGVGIAPFLLKPAERELREGTLRAIPIEKTTIRRVHNFVYRRDFPFSPLALQFKAYVNQAIREGVMSGSTS